MNPKADQFANHLQAVCSISRKSADRLGNDELYLAVLTISNHRKKSGTDILFCTRDSFVIVKTHILPFVIGTDVIFIMGLLCLKADKLLITGCGYTAVGCNLQLFLLNQGFVYPDFRYLFHQLTSLFG